MHTILVTTFYLHARYQSLNLKVWSKAISGARSLGTRVVATRVLSLLSITLLAGSATAMAGPIAFVGLMIPHVARWIVGPDQRWILAYSLLCAPILMVASDVLGRVLLPTGELQVGIVTAFLGAPVLVILVRRQRVSGL